MASGAVAGVSYWLVVYPFDLVKSRIQVNPDEKRTRYFTQVYRTFKAEGSALRYFFLGGGGGKRYNNYAVVDQKRRMTEI